MKKNSRRGAEGGSRQGTVRTQLSLALIVFHISLRLLLQEGVEELVVAHASICVNVVTTEQCHSLRVRKPCSELQTHLAELLRVHFPRPVLVKRRIHPSQKSSTTRNTVDDLFRQLCLQRIHSTLANNGLCYGVLVDALFVRDKAKGSRGVVFFFVGTERLLVCGVVHVPPREVEPISEVNARLVLVGKAAAHWKTFEGLRFA
mmetsp:Transcript_40428/g.94966  ORF Transcript_40428/g.94966 Transcript_40428/m.94966 type:complete len:203 (+) Transcript_40428:666-1274(+)